MGTMLERFQNCYIREARVVRHFSAVSSRIGKDRFRHAGLKARTTRAR